MEVNRFRPGCDLCSVKSSVSVQNSSGDNGPAGGGPAQQARHKWDPLKNQNKVAAGLNEGVETEFYLFYSCKLIICCKLLT